MLSKTDRLIEQQIARYFRRLSAVTKIGLLTRSLSVNMNDDEEADADDLASEVETDRTRLQDCSRGYSCYKARKKKTIFAPHFPFIFIVFAHENN